MPAAVVHVLKSVSPAVRCRNCRWLTRSWRATGPSRGLSKKISERRKLAQLFQSDPAHGDGARRAVHHVSILVFFVWAKRRHNHMFFPLFLRTANCVRPGWFGRGSVRSLGHASL